MLDDGGAPPACSRASCSGHVNRLLARHGRKLGPDPASTDIACVGGVIANNSGGMRCGVVADSYRTVRCDDAGAGRRHGDRHGRARRRAALRRRPRPSSPRGLAQIRDELRADPELAERVARKFEIKNTTGYRLCAFLDADAPLEIFRRLVIGSEGTLAFVAEAVFETVPLGAPHDDRARAVSTTSTPRPRRSARSSQAGATATELMVAPTLIAAAYNMPGTPERWKELPPSSAALLVEFRAEEPRGARRARAPRARRSWRAEPLIGRRGFSRDREEIEMLWHVREGMQGLLAAIRPPGRRR